MRKVGRLCWRCSAMTAQTDWWLEPHLALTSFMFFSWSPPHRAGGRAFSPPPPPHTNPSCHALLKTSTLNDLLFIFISFAIVWNRGILIVFILMVHFPRWGYRAGSRPSPPNTLSGGRVNSVSQPLLHPHLPSPAVSLSRGTGWWWARVRRRHTRCQAWTLKDGKLRCHWTYFWQDKFLLLASTSNWQMRADEADLRSFQTCLIRWGRNHSLRSLVESSESACVLLPKVYRNKLEN